jgi:hypothetical protein
MSTPEVDFFFRDPRSAPESSGVFSRLYLLRRDIFVCFELDPTSGERLPHGQAIWPGTVAILIGTDLLAQCLAGADGQGVGERFRVFAETYFKLTASEARALYQLRNAMLHSFALFSEDWKGTQYRFAFSDKSAKLITPLGNDEYAVNLAQLANSFEDSARFYFSDLCNKGLPNHALLHQNFMKIFVKYGHAKI